MRVVANEAFTFFYNHVPINVAEGEPIDSDVAVFLLNTRAAVRPDDEDAQALAEELGLNVTDDGQEQEPNLPPPPPPGTGDPNVPDPPQTNQLDIDASVKVVLAWVGTDPARAAQALELEQAKPEPRSTLVTQLEKTAAAGA
ncbi:hypothetical protein AB0D59_01310 [Streptomyces sp. NPDC048417]|uniref:hypothetical protein n=1 Tax=Streptomyces sp. NPDC048417 TaxID=3155387 RepID=UPI0034363C90